MRKKSIQLLGLTLLLGLTTSACGEVHTQREESFANSPQITVEREPSSPEQPSSTTTPSSGSRTTSAPSPRTSPKTSTESFGDRQAFSTPSSTAASTNSPRTTTSHRNSPYPGSLIRNTSYTRTIDSEEVHLEISLSRREVTLYQGTSRVKSYPIGIGRAGWETPLGTFEVQQMRENPVWIHPFTDERIPSNDSRNPLGTRWIGFWTDGHLWVGFHGTSDPSSVGTAASHGCIRMHNEDVEELFAQIEIGTPVTVVR
jgi:lipoprotein-anchoring transpeptidase ErfK/SrfK